MALGFARLAIIDTSHHGIQPMSNLETAILQDIADPAAAAHAAKRPLVLSLCNGELYNHHQLHESELDNRVLPSHSDCQIIAPLFEKYCAGQTQYPHTLKHYFNLFRGVAFYPSLSW